MAEQFYTSNFQLRSGTGTQTITGVPFTPKAVIIYTVTAVTLDVWQDTGSGTTGMQLAMGVFDDSLNQEGSYHRANEDASPDTMRGYQDAIVISMAGTSAVVTLAGAVTAITSDGFTINWTTNDASLVNSYIFFVAIGGANVQAKVGHGLAKGSAGSQGYTGIGFKPDAVLFGSGLGSTASYTSATTDIGGPSFGVYAGAQGQVSNIYNQVDNQNPSFCDGTLSTAFCVGKSTAAANSLDNVAAGTSLDNDGFTLTWSGIAQAANRFFYLALKGVTVRTGTILQPTATGNQDTAVSGTPQCVIFLSHSQTGIDNVNRTNLLWTMGAYDGTRTSGIVAGSNNNVSPGQTAVYISATNPLTLLSAVNATPGSTTTLAQAAASFVGNNIRLNWTTADSVQRYVAYIAFTQGGGGAGHGGGGHKGGGGVSVLLPGGATAYNIGNPGVSIGST